MGDAPLPQGDILLFTTYWPCPEDLIADIQKKHPQLKIVYHQIPSWGRKKYPSSNEISACTEDFENVTILATTSALPTKIEQCRNLKFIHFFSAGTDGAINTPIYKDTDITLTTSSGIHGPQIAEWVILQMLASSHKEKLLLKWQREHTWGSHQAVGTLRDLVGQRLGVLGYGSIGRQAARISKAMGMDVIAYTASPKPTPESRKDNGYVVPGTGDIDGTIPSAWYSGTDKKSLHTFLSQDIDILLISVPLTASTKYFLGAEEFAILGKRNAHIINISRGKVMVQDELIKALKKPEAEGGLRAASLDVTDPEPLPKESELWDLENVVVTPHSWGLDYSIPETKKRNADVKPEMVKRNSLTGQALPSTSNRMRIWNKVEEPNEVLNIEVPKEYEEKVDEASLYMLDDEGKFSRSKKDKKKKGRYWEVKPPEPPSPADSEPSIVVRTREKYQEPPSPKLLAADFPSLSFPLLAPRNNYDYTCEPAEQFEPDQSYSKVLLAHASLYVLGDYQLIDSLKALALYKLHKTLRVFQLNDENVEDIVDLARYAYSEEGKGLEEGIGALRGLVCHTSALKIGASINESASLRLA
ncbi:hypothetical protein B7463_g2683, partial [Scytalidium lignicola]